MLSECVGVQHKIKSPQTFRANVTFVRLQSFHFVTFYIFGVFINIYMKVFCICAASDCYADQYGWYIVQCWLTLHLVQATARVTCAS